jgi:hypothetical protein
MYMPYTASKDDETIAEDNIRIIINSIWIERR